MKKVLLSLLTIAVVGSLITGGVMAYFSDTEESTGNTFTAGTIDLNITEGQIIHVGFEINNMKPGDEVSGSTSVQNVGSLDGWLFGRTTYTTFVGTNPPEDNTVTDLGKMLKITSWTEPSGTYSPDITLYDFVHANPFPTVVVLAEEWMPYGTLAKNATANFSMTALFDPLAGNAYQNDGVIVKFEYLLVQEDGPYTP